MRLVAAVPTRQLVEFHQPATSHAHAECGSRKAHPSVRGVTQKRHLVATFAVQFDMRRGYVLTRRGFTTWVAGTTGLAFLGCSSEDGVSATHREPAVLPTLEPGSAVLTTERTIVPSKERLAALDDRNPLDPGDRESLRAEGFGDYEFGAGEPVMDRTPDGAAAPASGPNRKILTRFIHVSDIHVTDDESPVRMAKFDGAEPADGAARPQAAYMGRMLHAAVRTVNALHRSESLDFVMLGGDSTDSAQRNEMSWLVSILSGAPVVACDSGAQNDPRTGSNNDPKDPFVPEGLEIPWMFCMGNHDTEILGINAIGQSGITTATGSSTKTGVRDWSEPGGPVVTGDIPPDEDRRPLARSEMVALIAADGDGHGLASLSTDKASYVFDVDGTPLRFVVWDSALEEGGADGVLRQPDLEDFLKPALDKAKADGKLVVIVSHHGLAALGDGSAGSAATEAETLSSEDVQAFFLTYDNIVLSLTGHKHRPVVSWIGGDQVGFWDVLTCSLVEFPNQLRLVEIADEDNGHLSIQLVAVDFATDGDDVGEEGRRLAILDHTSGWGGGDVGTAQDRNVRLHIPVG